MKSVFKYKLEPGVNHISMPVDAETLTVHEQDGEIMLWALVNSDYPKMTRVIMVAGTGHPIYDGLEYIGSAFVGPFVWHVFNEFL